MTGIAETAPEADHRTGPRNNMFIAAAMDALGISSPVKVRNMSASGAMIETAVAPSVGTEVRLSRGSLLVSGKVTWSTNNRCGVQFASAVAVRDWMAPPANAGQAQVDAMVAQVRARTMTSFPLPFPASEAAPKSSRATLAHVSALLEELADALSDDVATVARHGTELQKIDQALQLLAAVRAD